MRFPVKDSLTAAELQKGLRYVLKDGMCSQTLAVLTTGVFLVAFALKLGASIELVGFIAAIPPLTQILSFFAAYIVQKYKKRRALCMISSFSSRIFWLFIAAIPFLFSVELGLSLFIITLFILSCIAVISSTSWNTWMKDLVPEEQLGPFFAKRIILTLIIGLILTLAAGFFIDFWNNEFSLYPVDVYSYSILFFIAFLAGMLGIYFISRIPEPRMETEIQSSKLRELLSKPFRDTNYRRVMIFLTLWNFAINLASPFFVVVMIKQLNLDMGLITILTVLSQTTNIIFLGFLGRLSKYSNKSVLQFSSPIFLVCILVWVFTTAFESIVLVLSLLIIVHIFTGISTAGVTLAMGNITLRLAPKKDAAPYLATNTVFTSLAAGIAPIIGGFLFQLLFYQNWNFYFLVVFLIGLLSMFWLSKIKETGEVTPRTFIHEFLLEIKRGVRNFSSAAGIHHMIHFPSFLHRRTIKERQEQIMREKIDE